MRINVLTLFPEMFTPIQTSILGRGLEDKKWELNIVNFREFSERKHHSVDDTPYGGGAGMVTNHANQSSIRFIAIKR